MPAHQACYDVLLVCLLLLPNQGRVPNQPNAAAAFPPLELMENATPTHLGKVQNYGLLVF